MIPEVEQCNLEAEEAVLGAILINPDALLDVAPFLKPSHFWLGKNGMVYTVVLHLYEQRRPVDLVTVTDELSNRGQLKEVGGLLYISRLMDNVPSALHAADYAQIVENHALRRELRLAAGAIAAEAAKENKDLEDVLSFAEEQVFAVGERRIQEETKTISQAVEVAVEAVELARDQHGIVGIPAGINSLDRMTSGFRAGELVLVAGRPGMGKTALLLNMAHYAAKIGKQVAVFSLEQPDAEIASRLVTIHRACNIREGMIPLTGSNLRSGQMTEEQWKVFYQAAGELSNLPIYVDTSPALTPITLRAKARRLVARHKVELVIVDYLQLMTTGRNYDSLVREITTISRQLKALARELGVPVVVASQLSRNVEHRANKRPMLSDLRESGSLEQDADVVLFVYRDEYYDENTDKPGVAELILAKQRNGPTGTVDTLFAGETCRFQEAVHRQFVQ